MIKGLGRFQLHYDDLKSKNRTSVRWCGVRLTVPDGIGRQAYLSKSLGSALNTANKGDRAHVVS